MTTPITTPITTPLGTIAEQATACPLCRGTVATKVHEKNGYVIVRCTGCELVYVSPMPTEEDLARHYQQHSYFDGDCEQGYRSYADIEKALRPHFRRRLQTLARRHPSRGRLLDFGCASGFFLQLAQHDEWKITGVELAADMAQEAASRTGARVLTNRAALGDEEFDAITLWEVIEHLPQPVETVQSLARHLRPGGLLMLSTPNVAHWQAQHHPDAWVGYRPPSHLVHFTPSTLARTLEAGGLTDVQIAPTAPRPPLPNWLETVTRSLQESLADGSARPWRLALFAWRGVRAGAWGWQRLVHPDEDIFTTLEAVAVKPA